MNVSGDFPDFPFQSGPGKRLAVLGDPVRHSLSPAMHNAALAEMAQRQPLLKEWHYHAIRVPAAELSSALPWLHEQEVCGINLTLPHKVEALALIDSVEPMAARMGAVNTLIRTPRGYRGTNTDGYGVTRALEESFGGGFAGRDVWIFGAGGAARGIAVAALEAGCQRLTVVNRTADRLHGLRMALEASGPVPRCRFLTMAEAKVDADPQALLINATSLGLKESDPSPVPGAYLEPGRDIYDSTYGAANALWRASVAAGCRYADGLSMLVWQGARSLEIWTGEPVPVETMRAAAMAALKERQAP